MRKHTRPRTRTRPSDWWVATVHGPETRIGTDDTRAVAQPQAVRRLAEFRVPHDKAQFPCTSTSMSFSHLRIGNGLRSGGAQIGTPARRLERHTE